MENVLPGDIKQGNLGNCWLIASLTGLANVPDGINRICVEYDTSKCLSNFVLHHTRSRSANADNCVPSLQR